jgi:RND family efflux transporter MFP subunit
VAEAQAMMSYVEILAPFDGVVTKKWADVGDLASPGKPLIGIEDPSVLQLEADVPEAIALRIQRNATLSIRSDSLKEELAGTVREIAPTADPASRTIRVKLDLPQRAGLMSGQFARLVVPLGENSSVCVPASAVILRGQLEILFVVTNQRAQLHLVKTGKKIDEQVEILAGIEPGESVVVGGAALLTDGQPVEAK